MEGFCVGKTGMPQYLCHAWSLAGALQKKRGLHSKAEADSSCVNSLWTDHACGRTSRSFLKGNQREATLALLHQLNEFYCLTSVILNSICYLFTITPYLSTVHPLILIISALCFCVKLSLPYFRHLL